MNIPTVGVLDQFKRPHRDILLNLTVGEFTTNQAFRVVECGGGVAGEKVAGAVPDDGALGGEGHDGWGGAVALVVGDDLDPVVTKNSDAGVGGAEINANDPVKGLGVGRFVGGGHGGECVCVCCKKKKATLFFHGREFVHCVIHEDCVTLQRVVNVDTKNRN